MLGTTHMAWAPVFTLGLADACDFISLRLDHVEFLNPGVVAVVAVTSVYTSHGRWFSPDMDQRWAPGRPRQNYNWRFHRGITHRVWFASMLTLLFGILPMVVLQRIGVPRYLCYSVLGPMAGWWSHLSGDMIYGRIKIMGSPIGLGWQTGGLSETGRRKGGKRWLPTNPAERVCTALLIPLVACQVALAVASVR
jgi:hypothetical protein